jgi:zinc protease
MRPRAGMAGPGRAFVVAVAMAAALAIDAGAAKATPTRRPGPAGSLIIVETNPVVPLVQIAVAVRSGSGWDPHNNDWLSNLAATIARRGAAGQSREQLDARIDALGATLEVRTDPDSVRFEGHVLARSVDQYLAVLADILLRPDFTAAEVGRTRREILADIDEARNDDDELGRRFFVRNLFGDHPYGHPPEGHRAALERIRREELVAHHRRHVVGPNLIFAAAGAVEADDFAARVQRLFGGLASAAAPGPNPLVVREPLTPSGWRIQIVDKPERHQAHIWFGQFGVRATDPDYVPLLVALTSFGGAGMKTTLMEEVRTRRGLAYGAYMGLSERLGRGSISGWVSTSNDKAVTTLKTVLRLFLALGDKGIDDRRLTLAKSFLAGSRASELDDPERRLDARLSAEIVGLPPTFTDDFPARVRAVTAAEVKAAIGRRIRAKDLAITVVATAGDMYRRLLEAKVESGAVDVVPFDDY